MDVRLRRALVLLALVLVPVSSAAAQGNPPVVMPPVATQEVAPPAQNQGQVLDGGQLWIDTTPMTGMQLFYAGRARPDYFHAPTAAGGDLLVNVFEQCVTGYVTRVSNLGMAWVNDSGPVDIRFEPSDGVTPTGIFLWDVMAGQWWCTSSFSVNGSLSFNNLARGIYFVWAVSAQPGQIGGEIRVLPQAGSEG